MSSRYAYWRAELAKPGLLSRDTSDPINGFWRIQSAKTKPDYPVAIWHDGETELIQIGRKEPIEGISSEAEEFRQWGWMKCAAVTEEEYHRAIDTGFWSDGKPSRKMSEEEKLGIDTASGGNNPPVEESLKDQIDALVEKAKKTPEPRTQEEANAATEIVDKLRKLWKIADEERKREKKPHDDAAQAVQDKWLPIMAPAQDEGAALDNRRKAFLRKEQDRLDRIAAEERRKREEEARAERERLAEEARKAAKEAGEDPDAVEVPDIAIEPVEAPRATAGGAYGRNSGLKRVKVGYVEDAAKLTAHFLETGDADFAEYLDKRVKAAARSKVTLPGMIIKEELK